MKSIVTPELAKTSTTFGGLKCLESEILYVYQEKGEKSENHTHYFFFHFHICEKLKNFCIQYIVNKKPFTHLEDITGKNY